MRQGSNKGSCAGLDPHSAGVAQRAGLLGFLLVTGLAACSPNAASASDAIAGGGAAPAGGSAGAPVSAGGAGGSLQSAGGAPDLCPEVPALHQPSGISIALAFAPTLAGQPFVFAEPNAMPGGQVSPTNMRFYVSELSLLQADGSAVPVDLVSATGKVEPYGVHLVNFEEAESATIHVLAPAGTYSGARFTFGINDACNSGSTSRNPPLSVNSQMAWPHLAGYLFLRYEGQWLAEQGSTEPAPPSMIHMGGVVGSVFAPQATVTGSLTVPATGDLPQTIHVAFDEIFAGATSAGDVSNVLIPTPEVVAGEHLRRSVPTLPIFSVAAP